MHLWLAGCLLQGAVALLNVLYFCLRIELCISSTGEQPNGRSVERPTMSRHAFSAVTLYLEMWLGTQFRTVMGPVTIPELVSQQLALEVLHWKASSSQIAHLAPQESFHLTLTYHRSSQNRTI